MRRFLVGLIFIGMCAGVYLWTVYDPKVINIIELYTGMGVIFSSIGAIATVFVFCSTAQATKNAIKSVEIAEKNLRESREYNKETLKIAEASLQSSLENSRKDDFIKQLTLLLEQHNRSHDALAKSIDSNDGQLISDSSSFIQWDMTLEEASKKLFQNFQYSPYMRILYRNLKYINESFYLVSNNNKYIEEKKQYTAILRSVIRNDILFLVAINAKNEIKIFRKYEKMLKDFSFFEHVIVDNIGEKIKFNIDGKKENFSKDLKNLFKYHLNKYLMETVDIRTLFKMQGTGDKMILSSSFVYEVMKEFSTWQYDLFKSYLIKSIRNCYFDLKRLGENDFFSNDCFYIWKGVVVRREIQMFSQFDHIELGSKKILNNSVPISLLKNSESILNGKIYISDECIDLKNGIFFRRKDLIILDV